MEEGGGRFPTRAGAESFSLPPPPEAERGVVLILVLEGKEVERRAGALRVASDGVR